MPGLIPRKILIVRLGALGDIIHAIPAQQALLRQLPGAEIHWLAEAAYAELLRCVPGIRKVWLADTRRWRRQPHRSPESIRLVRSLRRQRFDLAFDFQGLLKSALLARLSGAGRVIGFAPERFKEKGIGWFYSQSIEGEADLNRHVIEGNMELVRQVGGTNGEGWLIPLSIPPTARRDVDERLGALRSEWPILINPGAGWVTKLWPARNYARLGLEIRRRLGIPVVYAYGPGETPLIDEIRQASAPQSILTFPTSIVELAALCQRCRLLVGSDSGPLHLAVALGTPTVAVLGPTSPRRNGPVNRYDEVVRRDLPCSDCYKRSCGEFICMDIPTQEVFEAVRRRLNGVRREYMSGSSS
ncbi:MAG: glycosyltransferase family 9 protein [Acidobacteriota bacterium]